MEQLKNYFKMFKDKLDEDPHIKKVVIGVGVLIAAIVLMTVIKSLKANSDNSSENEYLVQAEETQTVIDTPQTAQTSQYKAPEVAPQVNSQQIVTSAVKPLASLSNMTPGYVSSYSYAIGSDINQELNFAKVADINKDLASFQFLVKPDDVNVESQIIPGNVVLKTISTGYFIVEKQSSPLLNLLITSGNDSRNVEVYLDDMVLPSAVSKVGNWGDRPGSVSIPITQALGEGLHRIKVISLTRYNRRDVQTAIRVSMKREGDSVPSDLQVYRELPPSVEIPSLPIESTAQHTELVVQTSI